jgi:hypothetical protein
MKVKVEMHAVIIRFECSSCDALHTKVMTLYDFVNGESSPMCPACDEFMTVVETEIQLPD